MSGYDSAIKTQTLLHVSIFIETVCSFFPAYYNWIYMLTPNYWRFRRACQTVHKFSLEVIHKRRADLEQKVSHTHSEIQRSGSDFTGLVLFFLPVRGREKMCWMEERENTLILSTCYWKQRYVLRASLRLVQDEDSWPASLHTVTQDGWGWQTIKYCIHWVRMGGADRPSKYCIHLVRMGGADRHSLKGLTG